MQRTRAERRYFRKKKIDKRINVLLNIMHNKKLYKPEGFYHKFNLSCNCTMCGNERKHFGKITLKEEVQKDVFVYSMDELLSDELEYARQELDFIRDTE